MTAALRLMTVNRPGSAADGAKRLGVPLAARAGAGERALMSGR